MLLLGWLSLGALTGAVLNANVQDSVRSGVLGI